jgi:hypothetical protein
MHVEVLASGQPMPIKCYHTGCLQDFLADEAKLRRRLVAAAAANLLLSPFLLMFLVIYFFMKHAEKFYHSPGECHAASGCLDVAMMYTVMYIMMLR